MFKKLVLAVCLLICVLSFNVSAKDHFYVSGEDDSQVSQILGLTENELKEYCQSNNITYLAVTQDNKKQIRKTENTDDFSKKIINLSALGDNEILELTNDLSGFEDAKGQIVNFKNQKFLKTEHKTADSGGEYVITQYITVKNAKRYVLTFFTDSKESRDYIPAVFENQFTEYSFQPLVVIGTVLFSLIGIAVTVLIVKELRKKD